MADQRFSRPATRSHRPPGFQAPFALQVHTCLVLPNPDRRCGMTARPHARSVRYQHIVPVVLGHFNGISVYANFSTIPDRQPRRSKLVCWVLSARLCAPLVAQKFILRYTAEAMTADRKFHPHGTIIDSQTCRARKKTLDPHCSRAMANSSHRRTNAPNIPRFVVRKEFFGRSLNFCEGATELLVIPPASLRLHN